MNGFGPVPAGQGATDQCLAVCLCFYRNESVL